MRVGYSILLLFVNVEVQNEPNSFLKLDNIYKVQGEIPVSQNDHWFGNRLDGPRTYGGKLDEFVIYDRVLTEDEIQQDMEQVLSVSPLDKAATTWGLLKKVGR